MQWLRSLPCPCCPGTGLIPGLGISICRCMAKKRKKKKTHQCSLQHPLCPKAGRSTHSYRVSSGVASSGQPSWLGSRIVWSRPVAKVLIGPLAWEPRYAEDAALKRQKRKKKKRPHVCPVLSFLKPYSLNRHRVYARKLAHAVPSSQLPPVYSSK